MGALSSFYLCISMFGFVFGLVLSPLNFILRLAGLGKADQPPPSARAKAKAVAQKAASTAPEKRRSTKAKPKSTAMSGAEGSAAQNGSPTPEDKSKLEQQATAKVGRGHTLSLRAHPSDRWPSDGDRP